MNRIAKFEKVSKAEYLKTGLDEKIYEKIKTKKYKTKNLSSERMFNNAYVI